jgi:hypothetical protein
MVTAGTSQTGIAQQGRIAGGGKGAAACTGRLFSEPTSGSWKRGRCGWLSCLHAVEPHKVVDFLVLDDHEELGEEEDERQVLVGKVKGDRRACSRGERG